MAKAAFYHLRLVHQLRPFLRTEDQAAHAFVTSKLGCGNVLYTGLPLKTVQKLQ